MNQEYLSIEDAKKLANYDKLLEENRMLKSNKILIKQEINTLKNKHKQEIVNYQLMRVNRLIYSE